MFKALLVVLAVLPDQAVPVAVMPYASMAECRKQLVVAVASLKESAPGKLPYVATCTEILSLPEKPGVKI